VNFFESICAQLITAMILGSLVTEKSGINSTNSTNFVMLPLALGCLDIISSTIGMWNVNTKPGMPIAPKCMQNPLNIMIDALRSAFVVGLYGHVAIFYLLSGDTSVQANLLFALCGILGMFISWVTILTTQYYVNYKEYLELLGVQRPKSNIHSFKGIAGGSLSTIALASGFLASYMLGQHAGLYDKDTGKQIGGTYGVAITVMGMFTNGVFVVSIYGFGPIAESAAKIVENAELRGSAKKATDRLSSFGQNMKVNSRGYNVRTGTLACFLMFSMLLEDFDFLYVKSLDLQDLLSNDVL
jgi:Na+/H+-translocating membrane pyrophosphatase